MHLMITGCVLLVAVNLVRSEVCTLQSFLDDRNMYDSNFDTEGMAESYNNEEQVRVNCVVGYTGFFKLICKNGAWTKKGTKCERKSCGHPGEAQFADFHLIGLIDDFVFGSQVEYICHKGYQMVSRRNVRNCVADGWDGNVPVCEAIQCPAIVVDNKVRVSGNPEESSHGNIVRFSCKSSSEVLKGAMEIYCDEKGEWIGVGWTGKSPTCEEIKCTAPMMIENGFVTGRIPEYRENEALDFSCNTRFEPVSKTSSKCKKVGQIAAWSPTPECERVKCLLDLPPPKGTSYEPARTFFTPDQQVTVTCGEMDWIENIHKTSAKITCKDDGAWSTRPVCLEVICTNHRDPLVSWWDVSSWHQKKLGSKARYTCISGYKPTTPDSKTECTRDGWTPKPLCQEIICQQEVYEFADIDTNVKSQYKFNEDVWYVCKTKLKEQFSIRCGENGWTGSPTCIFDHCEAPEIEDATMRSDTKQSRFNNGDSVEFTCTKSEETLKLTCKDGAWSGIQTCSAHKPCQKAEIQHGYGVSLSKDIVHYACDVGYKLPQKGWWAIARCEGGQWSGLQDCIDEKMCGAPPVIPHGKATPQQNNDQIIQITCDQGYSADVEEINCEGAKWPANDRLKTICSRVAVHCAAPPRVENAVIRTPYRKEFLSYSVVEYECREGYIINGQNTRECANGKWEENSITCIQKTCPDPEDTPNGKFEMIDGDKLVVGATIKYTCNDGFMIAGEHDNRTCMMDGWSNSLPKCEPASCQIPILTPDLEVSGSPSAGETVDPGHTLQFECSGNQQLEGTKRVKCLSNGKWDATFPTCIEYCTIPEVPRNVVSSPLSGAQVRKGENVSFSCSLRTHVIIQGSTTMECLANGEWDGTVPTCRAPRQCGPPPNLVHGDIKTSYKSTYANNEEVEYDCQEYYVMEGNPRRTCNNGGWIGQNRCIEPCTVNEDDMNTNNIKLRYLLNDKIYSSHNDTIEFVCKRGRPVAGVKMRQKCLEGEIQLPRCQ